MNIYEAVKQMGSWAEVKDVKVLLFLYVRGKTKEEDLEKEFGGRAEDSLRFLEKEGIVSRSTDEGGCVYFECHVR